MIPNIHSMLPRPPNSPLEPLLGQIQIANAATYTKRCAKTSTLRNAWCENPEKRYFWKSRILWKNPVYFCLNFQYLKKTGLGSRQIFFLLLTFFSNGSGSWFFSQAAPAPAPSFFVKRLRLQGAKNTRLRPAPAPDYWLSLPKYSFPHKLVRKNGKKNIKQVK